MLKNEIKILKKLNEGNKTLFNWILLFEEVHNKILFSFIFFVNLIILSALCCSLDQCFFNMKKYPGIANIFLVFFLKLCENWSDMTRPTQMISKNII